MSRLERFVPKLPELPKVPERKIWEPDPQPAAPWSPDFPVPSISPPEPWPEPEEPGPGEPEPDTGR